MQILSKRLAVLAVLALLAPLAPLASGSAGAQTPTALPPLAGGFESEATAINARGEVAGLSTGAGLVDTAVVWDSNAAPTALPPLAGDAGSRAYAINACGDVAGESFGGVFTAVVWLRGADPHGAAAARRRHR